MTKFSGSKRRPLRINLMAPIRTVRDAHAHARGRRGVHARRRVGPVPARGDEHGGRGHVLRARRRARRALRRARARGHGDEPGVRRGPGPVPARHDADAFGRDRHGRRVRRRGRRERPRRDRGALQRAGRAGRDARLLAHDARPQRPDAGQARRRRRRAAPVHGARRRCATTACRVRSAWPT